MWQGIIGHDRIVERFRRSLAHGRLASSYLFLGPAGVGKHTFAVQLAKALLCTSSPDVALAACCKCESCLLLDAGNHPDLDLVELPAGKRWLPVDLFLGDRDHRNQVGLCHNIALKPIMGGRRVAIIDDADFLTVESANCLLKTIEEPPPRALLILIGTSRSRQLPTILSRTQTVHFAPLSDETVEQILVEKHLVDSAAEASQWAKISGGSLRTAVDGIEANLVDFRQRFLRYLDVDSFDATRLAAILQEFVNAATGTEAEAKRHRFRIAVHTATEYLSSVLKRCAGAPARDRAADSDRFLAALERCIQAEEEVDRNANQSTLLECWVDDLARNLDPRLQSSEIQRGT